MDFIFTERFKKSCKKLSDEEQKTLQKKLVLMSLDPHHPSLRTKKVKGTDNIFECTIDISIRMTWQYDGESILLLVIGAHDAV